jgi:hypothetical protein
MDDQIEHIGRDDGLTEAVTPTTSRGKFLKRLGVTLAAAIGVAGALASSALATPGQCCKDCGQCGSCGSGKCYCFCDCSGISQSYCWTASQGCLSSGCVSCPC